MIYWKRSVTSDLSSVVCMPIVHHSAWLAILLAALHLASFVCAFTQLGFACNSNELAIYNLPGKVSLGFPH